MSPIALTPTPSSGKPFNHRFAAITIIVMLAIFGLPVLAYLGLESLVRMNCDTREVSRGVVDGPLEWRLEAVACKGGTWHDLSIGLRDKTPGLAANMTADTTVVEVRRTAQRLAEIVLRNKDGSERIETLRLKPSGAPAERLDLTRPAR